MSIILIAVLAFVAEFIDSSLGMMYGTLLSPILIIMGIDPLVVIPSILFSQALGGLTASIFHNRYNNADFRPKTRNLRIIKGKIKEIGLIESFKKGFSKDFKIAFVVASLGILATIFAACLAVNISKLALNIYIGILICVIGMFLLSRIKLRFSWKMIIGIGIISSFNKGLSGGGFGPIVTSGQIVGGNNPKSSIGATTLAEAPICIVGFLTYYLAKGFSDWTFLAALCLGAVAAAPLGALFTSRLNEKRMRPILGSLTLLLGLWIFVKIIFKV